MHGTAWMCATCRSSPWPLSPSPPPDARRDKPGKPFRCLDPQYRRELVRVYLSNVEGVCKRFCEEKKGRLVWANEAKQFREFWSSLSAERQRQLVSEKGETVLKVGDLGATAACCSAVGQLCAGEVLHVQHNLQQEQECVCVCEGGRDAECRWLQKAGS